MFELKDRFNYKTYGGVNKNLHDWKRYETKMVKNSFGMNEIKVDLSDAELFGTLNSVE